MQASRGAALRFAFVAASLMVIALFAPRAGAQDLPASVGGGQKTVSSEPGASSPPNEAWPRQLTVDGKAISVYQPQVETWQGNQLTGRAAVSIQDPASPTPIFGVAWLSARTDVDKESHTVLLEDMKVTKVNFPSKPDMAATYQAMLAKALPEKSKTVSLDRIQASLAVTKAESSTQKLPLKNDPPRIIYSSQTAVLVLVDDKPVLRKVDGSNLMRVINTRALMLFDPNAARYYLFFMDHWLEATDIHGAWSVSTMPPAELNTIKANLADQHAVDLLDDPSPELKQEMEAGVQPVVYVSTTPAELIQTTGELQFSSIDGTQLLWVTNTDDDILYDTAGQRYYVRLSGRWFRSTVLTGPWEYVAGDKLPPDFAKVPVNHPKGEILEAVANTPQARQAVIANSIPQTATIKRADTTISPTYDGQPKLEPIADTPMHYAVNTATPVIQVADNSYYAIENGVWFTAAAAAGPWVVATTVPPVIYSIPPANPLYYVTYAQIYGFTPDYVYCGYTPGYFGTCVAPYGCLVYGTGWNYRPWIGNYWYGRPWSYGYAASVHWSPATGWGLGYAARVGGPWWDPAGWGGYHEGVWRSGWAGGYSSAYGARYANVHGTRVNVSGFNAYNRWGAHAVDVHHTSINTANVNRTNINNTNINRTNINNTNINRTNVNNANVNRTNVNNTNINRTSVNSRQLNNVYAGADGSVYRRSSTGWERNEGGNWRAYNGAEARTTTAGGFAGERQSASAANLNRSSYQNTNFDSLNRDFESRRTGEMNYSNFHSSGGFGGYRGFSGGGRGRR
jgi:hypothetical protein